jgi:nucleoid-associated protein YgaU
MSNRYQDIQVVKYNSTGSQYYTNNLYPDVPYLEEDNYVITTVGDRLDLLAFDFYGDAELWWVIASANSLPGDSLVPIPGTQLRIPTDLNTVLSLFNNFNLAR